MTTVGSGWTKVSQDGKTQISIQIDDTFKEMFPQLKNLRFGLTQLLQSERTNPEKSPHWKVYAYTPLKEDSKKIDDANKAIAAQANADNYDGYAYEQEL